ncbi:MAG TPA: hypothetical protein VK587_05225 [bacterium]|nr:hypothetical protein [bacterium]
MTDPAPNGGQSLEVVSLEIDIERVQRALGHFGAAMEEAQKIVRPGPSGAVRIHTDDRVIELPLTWAVAGLAAFAIATMLSSLPLRREREEEPIGIG